MLLCIVTERGIAIFLRNAMRRWCFGQGAPTAVKIDTAFRRRDHIVVIGLVAIGDHLIRQSRELIVDAVQRGRQRMRVAA